MTGEGFKLFVGDLPDDISVQELEMVFKTYGEVTRVNLLPPHGRPGSRCALLFYAERRSAEDAVSVLNGLYRIRADSKTAIRVSWARDRRERSELPMNTAPSHSDAGGAGGCGFLPVEAEYGFWHGGAGGSLDPDGFKLFVGGLPADCSQQELLMVFQTYGEVNKVHIMQKQAQTGRVAAFIYYKTAQAGEDAIALLHNQYKIREDADQPIIVRWAQTKVADPPKLQSAEGWKIFVGGLPADITEVELRTVFKTYGDIAKLHLMPPNAQGKAAAFVYYVYDQSGEDAIKVLHGLYKIRHNATEPIQVRWAFDRSCKGDGKGDISVQDFMDQQEGDGGGDGGGGGGGCSAGGAYHPEFHGGSAANGGGSCGGGSCGSGGAQAGQGLWMPRSDGGHRRGKESDTKLFVGNLPEDVNDEALLYVFRTYGDVRNVHIMTGKSVSGNACAFVEMRSSQEAETAILTLHDKYEIKPGFGRIVVKRANANSKTRTS